MNILESHTCYVLNLKMYLRPNEFPQFIRVLRKFSNILTKPTWYNSVFTLLNSAIKKIYIQNNSIW